MTADPVERQKVLRLWLGQFICREWNSRHGEKSEFTLLTFKIHVMVRNNDDIRVLDDYLKTGLLPGIVRNDMVWSHKCFADGEDEVIIILFIF